MVYERHSSCPGSPGMMETVSGLGRSCLAFHDLSLCSVKLAKNEICLIGSSHLVCNCL